MSFAAVSIGASGMQAASLRLDAVANNVANVETTGSAPNGGSAGTVYRPETVTLKDIKGGGVAAGVTSTDSYDQAYDPSAPYADASGMVAVPKIDLAAQMAEASYAQAQFAASARVVRAAQAMEKAAVDIVA